MQAYNDYWYNSQDGLTLYARDYHCENSEKTSSWSPGVTRNSADFASLCQQLCQRYRVIAVDLRGRGKSDYDSNPYNYQPAVYTDDIIALLDSLNLSKVSFIGTSLGGLVSMLLAATLPERVSSIVINDIGPEVNSAGIERIKKYVSKRSSVTSWAQAVANTMQLHGAEYPDFDVHDWRSFSENLYCEDTQGIPKLNYDKAIGQPMDTESDNTVPADLWSVFDAIKSIPTLLIRGQLSDILSVECAQEMQQRHSKFTYCEVQNRGHAPLLTESSCSRAIHHHFQCH